MASIVCANWGFSGGIGVYDFFHYNQPKLHSDIFFMDHYDFDLDEWHHLVFCFLCGFKFCLVRCTCSFSVAEELGQCFVTRVSVIPGIPTSWSFLIATINVVLVSENKHQ